MVAGNAGVLVQKRSMNSITIDFRDIRSPKEGVVALFLIPKARFWHALGLLPLHYIIPKESIIKQMVMSNKSALLP